MQVSPEIVEKVKNTYKEIFPPGDTSSIPEELDVIRVIAEKTGINTALITSILLQEVKTV